MDRTNYPDTARDSELLSAILASHPTPPSAARPAAYLRRSYVAAGSPGDISRETQRDAVARLATTDGRDPADLVEYDDWGVSADVAKAEKRTDYARLLADMEAGKVSAVYAFDSDRLYRSVEDLLRLQRAARRYRVQIVTTAGPLAIGEDADPDAEASAFIGSIFGRLVLQKAKKRARAGMATRRKRGDSIGHAPFGFRHERADDGRIIRVPDPDAPVDEVVAAFRDAGTILGAAKLLNERGVPAPKGGTWHASPLRRIIGLHAPDLLPRRGASGRRVHGRSALAQLIRCHCGQVMTPNVARGQLYCYNGNRQGVAVHGRAHVRELDLMPWIKDEAKRLRTPGDAVELRGETIEARRHAITERRDRAAILYLQGDISADVHAAEKARAEGELEALDAVEQVVAIPKIDWSWPAAEINRVLRALWQDVRLDRDMRPIEATWRVPEWRRGRGGPKGAGAPL